ncbi:MAG: DUF1016 family protein [Bacteroidia bacterium]|nr:DUF1016 family protein [Bacteroidia bacterium]
MNRIEILNEKVYDFNRNTENDGSIIEDLLVELSESKQNQDEYKRIVQILENISDDDNRINVNNYKLYFYSKTKNITKAIKCLKLSILISIVEYITKNKTSSDAAQEIDAVFSFINLNKSQTLKIYDDFLIDWNDQEYSYYLQKEHPNVILNTTKVLYTIFLANKKLIISEFDAALDLYFNVLENDDKNWYSLFNIGFIYYKQRNINAAINYISKSINLIRDNQNEINEYLLADNYFLLANCNRHLKKYNLESDAYRLCLQVAPEYEFAKNNLAYSLYQQGMYAESMKYIKECIKENKDGEYPYYNMIRVLIKQGKYEDASKFIEKNEVKLKSKKSLEKFRQQITKKQNSVQTSNIEQSDELTIIEKEKLKHKDDELILTESTLLSKEIENEKAIEIFLEQRILNGMDVLGRKLKMFNAKDYGRQYPTPIGRIDLLTIDIVTNDIVIIELKKGKSDDEVSGQIARYIGYAKDEIAQPNQNVIGIVYVFSASDKLKYALKYNKEVTLHEYKNGLV